MFNDHMFAFATAHAVPGRKMTLPAPKAVSGLHAHEVFAEALLEKSPTRQVRSPLDWTVSFSVHLMLLSALLLLPLLYTQKLDLQQFRVNFMAAPSAPAAPPPPPPAGAAPRVMKAFPKSFIANGKLMAPSFVPKAVAMLHEPPAPPPDLGPGVEGGVVGGVPGGQTGGVLGGIIGGVLGSAGAALPPPPPTAAAAPKKPIKIGGNVRPPRLLYEPPFKYPELARQARIDGDVLIDAIIDDTGNVVNAHVISGHPMLIMFALQSVMARKYSPTYLNGSPVAVELQVTVHYHLD
jgi:periplasmic protein TonB